MLSMNAFRPRQLFWFLPLIFLCGCFTSGSQLHATNNPDIFVKGALPQGPQAGLNKSQVLAIWGEPLSRSNGASGEEVWQYESDLDPKMHASYELHFAGDRVAQVYQRVVDRRVQVQGNF